MLKIKLFPTGKKHQRSFRIVVAVDRAKSNGNITDQIGYYTPQIKKIEIDKEKLQKWIKNGAQLTTGVDKLLNPDKYPPKKYKKTKESIVKKETAPAPVEETPSEVPATE